MLYTSCKHTACIYTYADTIISNRVKPMAYLAWLLGHEGKGSVLYHLKNKWAPMFTPHALHREIYSVELLGSLSTQQCDGLAAEDSWTSLEYDSPGYASPYRNLATDIAVGNAMDGYEYNSCFSLFTCTLTLTVSVLLLSLSLSMSLPSPPPPSLLLVVLRTKVKNRLER